MTFNEYINQKNPRKLPCFTVQVTDEDVFESFTAFKRTYISLVVNNDVYDYLLSDGALYTIDKDGNKNKPTVFYFKNNQNNDL
jgi:hypothetical protein